MKLRLFHAPVHGWWSVAVLTGAVLLALPLGAQPLTGGPFILVGGSAPGGSMRGEGYSLVGSLAGGDISVGDDFVLVPGLLGLPRVGAGAVELQVEWAAGRLVRLWWAEELMGYDLEFADRIGPDALWQTVSPVPVGNEYIVRPDQPAHYYRLRLR